MTKLIDHAGVRYGRLVGIRRSSPGRWIFGCDCGAIIDRAANKVSSGNTSSCGCYRREVHATTNRTHGGTAGPVKSVEYTAWRRAKMRCYTPTNADFANYGGRGIAMDPVWRDDFFAFLSYMGPRPDGMSLDRINVDGNYEPGNVRWATKAQQSLNKQDTLRVSIDGKDTTLVEACRARGVNYHRAHYWMRRRGLDFSEAVARINHSERSY